MKYGFIGIGNMGGAILRGLLESGALTADQVLVCGRDFEKTKMQAQELGVMAVESQVQLVRESEVFFLGVEPKIFPEILPLVAEGYQAGKLCVSMAAGITMEAIQNALGEDAAIIRIMPNTPIKVQEGMVSVSRNHHVTEQQMEDILAKFRMVGQAEEVLEEGIHGVIGVSGSSPAYTYMYIKALANAAESEGMSPETARVFAAQAVLGAAKIALESEQSLDDLINAVCTPGGATEAAVSYLREQNLEDIVEQGARAASLRSKEMSKGE